MGGASRSGVSVSDAPRGGEAGRLGPLGPRGVRCGARGRLNADCAVGSGEWAEPPHPPWALHRRGAPAGTFWPPARGPPPEPPEDQSPWGDGGDSAHCRSAARDKEVPQSTSLSPRTRCRKSRRTKERTRQRRVGDEFAGGEHRREGNTSGVRRQPSKLFSSRNGEGLRPQDREALSQHHGADCRSSRRPTCNA